MLGIIDELLDLKILVSRVKEKLISQFESENLYALLVNIFYMENGEVRGTSPLKSIIITGDSNVTLISQNILNAIIRASNDYDIRTETSVVQILWRNWLSDDEYAKLVAPIDRTKIVNEVLLAEADLKLDTSNKLNKIKKIMGIDNYENYLEEFPLFDSITELPLYDYLKSSAGEGNIIDSIQEGGGDNDCTDVKVSVYVANKTPLLEKGKKNVTGDSEWKAEMLYFVLPQGRKGWR